VPDRFQRGAVYRFNYLWAREHDRGEESGRKDRPACLLLRPGAFPDVLVMFAITSQTPSPDRTFAEISATECAKAGLHAPAWIILDEYNMVHASRSPDFVSLDPTGRFSDRFLRKITAVVAQRIRAKTARAVQRN
jgi:hypothetical protein